MMDAKHLNDLTPEEFEKLLRTSLLHLVTQTSG